MSPNPRHHRLAHLSPLLLAAITLAVPAARALEVVQIDFSPHFNGDAIINGVGLFAVDQEQDGLDPLPDGWSYPTQSTACTNTVPDNAFFPANADHPDVQLGWANDDDGDNAWQTGSGQAGTSITVDLPDGKYGQIHLFVGADLGGPGLNLTLHYATGDPGQASWTGLPWYLGGGPGGGYVLAGGLSRGRWSSGLGHLDCNNTLTVTLIGRAFAVDPTRDLVSISLERVGDTGRLSVFGATAVTPVETFHANFRPHFNADVVVNGSPGAYDADMDTIEGVWAFTTDSVGCGDDLPDVAAFPAGSGHPSVELGWDNLDDGFNVWQTFETTGTITVQLPDIPFEALHLFATGAWTTAATLTLHYTTGDPEVFDDLAYPSWFDEPPPGYYSLIDGLDRGIATSPTDLVCEDVNDPGIVGRRFPVDSTRSLDRFTIERTDNDGEGVLNVWGATLEVHDSNPDDGLPALIFYGDFEDGDYLDWDGHP